MLLVWVPYRRSVLGRAAHGDRLVGDGELHVGRGDRAHASSSPTRSRACWRPIGGLLLTFVTYSGEASSAIGGVYTLNSIAAVVIGGTSLAGGAGSAIGSIFGALVLRTIGDLLFVFDLEPLWQPLFQGVILLAAVSLGSHPRCSRSTTGSSSSNERP